MGWAAVLSVAERVWEGGDERRALLFVHCLRLAHPDAETVRVRHDYQGARMQECEARNVSLASQSHPLVHRFIYQMVMYM